MKFCNANETLMDAGLMDAFPHFMDTVFSSLLLSYVIASSIVKGRKFIKDTTSFKPETSPRSLLFNAKVVLTLFLTALGLIRVLMHGMVFNNRGNVIVTSCLHVFLWPISLMIIYLGRRNLTPTTDSRSCSWILPIFWIFAFINENVILLRLMNEEWWRINVQSLADGLKMTVLSMTQFQNSSELRNDIEQEICLSPPDKLEIILFALRYVFTLMLFIIGLRECVLRRPLPPFKKSPSLEKKEEIASVKKPPPLDGYFGKLKMFGPFLWPKGSPLHQCYVFGCLLVLVAGRYVTVMRPQFYKKIVDSLSSSDKEEALVFRWDLVVAYIGAEFLQEILANLRSILWDQVEAFTVHGVRMSIFSHLHRLSLGWHLSKKTGEVIEACSRGTSHAQQLLRHLLLTILPSVADIGIAIIYLMTTFNIWFGIILFTTMIFYSGLTYVLTRWVSTFTDDVVRLHPRIQSTRLDSLLNFETVKCYNNEDYEIAKYEKSLLDCRSASFKRTIAYDIVHITQKAITMGGLLTGSLLCVYMIVTKQGVTPGDYVLFAAYTHKFFSPMYAFGGLYSFMERAFKEMEKMYDILNEEEDVKDIPGAPELVVTQGRIEFKDVSFNYRPEKPVLKNVSFVVHPGQTIAFVGPTGSGKSTIARLLFRLYNLQEGNISIDDQNITAVTQKSVRRSIGVVPQDTVLFNEDIRFNVRYGDLSASDEKVEEAVVAAEIHNAILRFPDGYNTKVGERGLKMSGGEKQRIAIARTVLKSAPITVLDEATSALDTQTERSIQASLNRLCASKTTIIIAHRLSTVIHAHQICVLKEGEIVERGTHEELLDLGEEYMRMWQSQIKELIQAEAMPSDDKGDTMEYNNNEKTEPNSCHIRLRQRNFQVAADFTEVLESEAGIIQNKQKTQMQPGAA